MDDIYKFITKVQSIAKIGKLFSQDPYALENYEELEQLSKQALEKYTGEDYQRDNLFVRDIYPTPNISVRALIFNDKKEILLVKEAKWETWSLPGGWCDLYESPMEAIVKECSQEAGCDVKITRLLALTNRASYLQDKSLCEYTACFLGEVLIDHHTHCHETTQVAYFPLDKLPTISHKYTLVEIKRVIEALEKGITVFD